MVLEPSSHIESRDDQTDFDYPYTITYTASKHIIHPPDISHALIKIPINSSQQLLRPLLGDIMSTLQSLSRQFNLITTISLPDRLDVTIV